MIFELVLQDTEDRGTSPGPVFLAKNKKNASWAKRFAFLMSCRAMYHEQRASTSTRTRSGFWQYMLVK